MKEQGEDGMTWPCRAAGCMSGTEANDALATDCSGCPFASLTAIVGAFAFWLLTGASGAKSQCPIVPLGMDKIG